jgi:hypothetical protein
LIHSAWHSIIPVPNWNDRPFHSTIAPKTPIDSPLKSNVAALNGNVPVLNCTDRGLNDKVVLQYGNVQAWKGKGEG